MWAEMRLRPWWRAPLLLLRRPGVAFALAVAALVVTVPAVATPLFVSASQSASLSRQIDSHCPEQSGAQVVSQFGSPPGGMYVPRHHVQAKEVDVGYDVVEQRRDEVSALAEDVHNLGPARESLILGWSDEILIGDPLYVRGVEPAEPLREFAHIAFRDGLEEELEFVEGPEGPGLYLPDAFAEYLDWSVGDTVEVGNQEGMASGPTVEAPISGFYKDMRWRETSEFWCTMGAVAEENGADGWDATVFADSAETLLDVAESIDTVGTQSLEFALDDSNPSHSDSEQTSADLEVLGDKLEESEPDEFAWVSTTPRFVERSNLVSDSLSAPIAVASAAGIGVGLLVVAASGLLWARRRQREVRVLAMRGASPSALGVKGMLEAAPAIVAGVVGGALLAWWLVRTVGPSAVIAEPALRSSWIVAGGCAAAVLAVVALAVRQAVAPAVDMRAPGRFKQVAARAPWELLIAAAAVAAWYFLDSPVVMAGENQSMTGAVVRIPDRLVLVPLLATLAVVIFVVRVVGWRFSRSRGEGPSGHARFLAWRRVVKDRAVATALLAGVAIPVAFAGYGAVVTDTVSATMDGRAQLSVGADVVVELNEPAAAPDEVRQEAEALSDVVRMDRAKLGPITASLLFVDPDTFFDAAPIVEHMHGDTAAEALDSDEPAVVLGGSSVTPEGGQTAAHAAMSSVDVSVSNLPELPASRGGFPVGLLDAAHLDGDRERSSVDNQWWIRTDDPEKIRDLVMAAPGLDVNSIRLADEVHDGTVYEPVTHTFGYLAAVAGLTSAVVVVGLLLHLESRSAAHRRAYVMLRRMGLRARTHRNALLWELGGLLGAGALLGSGLALALSFALSGSMNLAQGSTLGTVMAVPLHWFAVIGAATVVVVVASAGFAQSRVAKASPSEVLRGAN